MTKQIQSINVRIALGDLAPEEQDRVVAYMLSQLSGLAGIDSNTTYSALETCAMQVRVGRALDEIDPAWLFAIEEVKAPIPAPSIIHTVQASGHTRLGDPIQYWPNEGGAG